MERMDAPDLANHIKTQTNHGITWVDVQSPTKETLDRLEQEYGLHHVHLQESIQKVQHYEVEREKNYLFFVLHYGITHSHAAKLYFGQIGIFLGKNFLITIRSTANPTVSAFFEECQDEGADQFKHGSGYILYLLIKRLLDEISNMTDRTIAELDELERLVFDDSDSDAQRIGEVRRKVVRLRRIIGPKREILQDLSEQIDSFTGANLSKYYSNTMKVVNKLWEEIEEAKETVEIYKDADFTISTEKTNEILAVLTILFTFTIPITVVGTIYGMNVQLPGGIVAGDWTFLGRYTTLYMLLLLTSLFAIAMYLYFKKKRWF